jgi:galactokinase
MKEQLVTRFTQVFGHAPRFMARAPGRIEFIGNHTDYNGGPVLGAAIDRGVWVAVAPRNDGQRRFYSDFTAEMATLSASELKKQSGHASWVNYPLGVVAALPEFGCQVPGGFDFLAVSNLPPGAGLSSSAAFELASALTFLEMTAQHPSREVVVKIGKHAENNFVGVPCGILDQGVSGFGKKNELVFIDCRIPSFSTVPLPADAHFWIFNTHTKHALVDGLYAARHRECMEAAKALGVSQLVNADLTQLEASRGKLSEFAYRRAEHIIGEITRVAETKRALANGDLRRVGELLTQSHRSSQRLFENSTKELDTLVDALVETPEVYGARLTGGGFGGAVMALTTAKFDQEHAERIGRVYRQAYDSAPDVLHCQTDDGATLIKI